MWLAQRRVRRVCQKHRGEEKRKNARAKRQCWGGGRDEPTARDGNPEIPRSDTRSRNGGIEWRKRRLERGGQKPTGRGGGVEERRKVEEERWRR